jgi:hypothetical protein
MVVPEFPQSIGDTGVAQSLTPGDRTLSPAITTPSSSSARLVDAMSRPPPSPVTRLSPRAMPANSRALCDNDLSPGTRTAAANVSLVAEMVRLIIRLSVRVSRWI